MCPREEVHILTTRANISESKSVYLYCPTNGVTSYLRAENHINYYDKYLIHPYIFCLVFLVL